MKTTLVLFDIDGTLILSGGAGMRAMNQAFEQVFGRDHAFDGVSMPGRTDRVILADAFTHLGIEPTAQALVEFRDRYSERLADEIRRPGPRKGVMPGVRELLHALSTRPDVHLALLTGNFAVAARIKLQYFGLWAYFGWGAYGDEAMDRNYLMSLAKSQAEEHGLVGIDSRQILVIGDTPLDVACARSGEAWSLAVATGHHDVEALRQSGADFVFEDLSHTEAVVRVVNMLAE